MHQQGTQLGIAALGDAQLPYSSSCTPVCLGTNPVTNANDLTATEVVAQYKALADIERSFKVLKSEIELGPVHHRLPDRIGAHAMICFVALILQRHIRTRLRAQLVENVISPERALGR